MEKKVEWKTWEKKWENGKSKWRKLRKKVDCGSALRTRVRKWSDKRERKCDDKKKNGKLREKVKWQNIARKWSNVDWESRQENREKTWGDKLGMQIKRE